MNLDWINGPHVWFITLAYLAALLILVWCVFAPVIRLRRMRHLLRLRHAPRQHSQPDLHNTSGTDA